MKHFQVNVVGTRSFLAAAEGAGVDRVAHTSTWVVGRPPPDALATESTQPAAGDLRGPYRRTKWLAEQGVLAAVARGREVVIASQGVPIGPWDVKPTPTGRIVLDFIAGRMPLAIGVHLGLLDVEDVARGHIAASRRGNPGERYLLGNLGHDAAGRLVPTGSTHRQAAAAAEVSVTACFAAAYVDALVEGVILCRERYLPLQAARLARRRMAVDCTRAVSELDLSQSSIAGALEKSVLVLGPRMLLS